MDKLTSIFTLIMIVILTIISVVDKRPIKEPRKINEVTIINKQNAINSEENLLYAVSFLNQNVDPAISIQIVITAIEQCVKHGLPPLLILCIIKEESNFNPLAQNNLGTVGLMQIIPKYHQSKIDKYKIKRNQLFFIENNIVIGCEILKEYFSDTGNIVDTLQKYVGATVKENAAQYIENIINNYITLEIMLYNSITEIVVEASEDSKIYNDSLIESTQ